MTAILYVKRPFCEVFDEVTRGRGFNNIQDAINHACDSKLTNTRCVYKITMAESGASKVFTKSRR